MPQPRNGIDGIDVVPDAEHAFFDVINPRIDQQSRGPELRHDINIATVFSGQAAVERSGKFPDPVCNLGKVLLNPCGSGRRVRCFHFYALKV